MPDQFVVSLGHVNLGCAIAVFQVKLDFSLQQIEEGCGSVSLLQYNLIVSVQFFGQIEEDPNYIGGVKNRQHFVIENFIGTFK